MDGFASRLARARKRAGLTQQELALAAGLAQGLAVSTWERGVSLPRLDHVAAIARVLGVSVDWLVGTWDEEFSRGGAQ